ncbi:somatostatin 6 [Salminus brasiliensis]|uniref:somatostatin 6 n=1 Tax=Salminus brasiliensis TaxID=930266 RepID=UPI003B82DACE
MALNAGGDTCGAADGGMFIMRMLLSLVPLLLIAWSGTSTDALPIDNNLPQSIEVLTKEQKDLLMKIMSDLAELNMTVKDLGALDLEQLLNGKLGERSVLGLPAREKSPCKNFFWKTFSAC